MQFLPERCRAHLGPLRPPVPQVLHSPVARVTNLTLSRASILGSYHRTVAAPLVLNFPWASSTVVPDIAFAGATALRDALYPSGSAPASIIGMVHTRLRPPTTSMAFKVRQAKGGCVEAVGPPRPQADRGRVGKGGGGCAPLVAPLLTGSLHQMQASSPPNGTMP